MDATPDRAATIAATRAAIIDHFQPIGCGARIGMPGRETTCGVCGLCSPCYERRERRAEMLAVIDGVHDD